VASNSPGRVPWVRIRPSAMQLLEAGLRHSAEQLTGPLADGLPQVGFDAEEQGYAVRGSGGQSCSLGLLQRLQAAPAAAADGEGAVSNARHVEPRPETVQARSSSRGMAPLLRLRLRQYRASVGRAPRFFYSNTSLR